MQARKIAFRIMRLLAKAIAGILLLGIVVLALIHVPLVQKAITGKVSAYLSSRIQSKVEIERIRFSVFGAVAIEEIGVWDPGNTKLFSAKKIEVTSGILDLMSGDLIFDEVHISGFDGKLVQSEGDLNIQYIIDAFKPKQSTASKSSKALAIQFHRVILENSSFEFSSVKNGVSVTVTLGEFSVDNGELSTMPTVIKADQVKLNHTSVNTLVTTHSTLADTSASSVTHPFLLPDFGTGIAFDIKNIILHDNDVSFHKDHVVDTKKFDPAHLSVKNIQLSLSDIHIRNDELTGELNSLAAALPGVAISNAQASVKMNREQLIVSSLQLASGSNTLQADLTIPLDIASLETETHAPASVVLNGQVNPIELAYFFNDSVMDNFKQWGITQLSLDASYNGGTGSVKELNLETDDSHLRAQGFVQHVLNGLKFKWKDVSVNAVLGSDFKKIMSPFVQHRALPPQVSVQLKSSGDIQQMYANGNVITSWGNAGVDGHLERKAKAAALAIALTGEKIDLGKWLDVSWAGPVDLKATANGVIGEGQNIEVKGFISKSVLLNQPVYGIAIQSSIGLDTASVTATVTDPNYRTQIHSEISWAQPLIVSSDIQLDSFSLGKLLHQDSTLLFTGSTKSKIVIDPSSFEVSIAGNQIRLQKKSYEFKPDTLAIYALMSSAKSDIRYFSDFGSAELVSNFDIRQASEALENMSGSLLKGTSARFKTDGIRTARMSAKMENASFIKLLGVDVEDFTSLMMKGEFDEQSQRASVEVTSGRFEGYGITLDSLRANLVALRDTVSASLSTTNAQYKTIQLGNLDVGILSGGDTAVANLILANDSVTLLGLQAHFFKADSGTFIFPNKLLALNHDYFIQSDNPIFIGNGNIVFDHFQVTREDLSVKLNGDLHYFDVSLENLELTPLNFLLSPDTAIISSGLLTGAISYTRNEQLDFKANIDSLSLYSSAPFTVSAQAATDGKRVPFEATLNNDTNEVRVKGQYSSVDKQVEASLNLEIEEPEVFSFLVADIIDDMQGAVHGRASIQGPIQNPLVNGSIRFRDLSLTTVNPRLTFLVQDDSIALDNSSVQFNHFALFDAENHPLTIDGTITSKDYQSMEYDLHIESDQYTLINNPDSTSGKVRGTMVIDSDIFLKGNEKDRQLNGNLVIKDATDLTFVTSSDDIELLKAEGIVEFVDPATRKDTLSVQQAATFYDSLIASLPELTLNANLALENNATLGLIIDEQSGDYIEASGSANLDLGYDRTGNLRLSGNYTINKGVYRLSFYDLVKKNFALEHGSSINWSGNPKNGDLNIKAVHTVASNSIGLIGHEIGENEKSVYKRSLDYKVGINISGTIDKPIVSFSLDLPKDDKVSYPVLANKLDRLRQPEYESELNKQVFGLLVLGGFLPESSGSDINSTLIATTALSNSVNSLLASQLNRFANQYIKGVNIDVGIQSFSDYSTPGGKTQTAMDFRVSKSIMNDRLSFEIGGDFDINQDQSGANKGNNYRGDIAIIYDLTGNGDKQLKLFNNETYDIIYQEIRNTGISLIFIREFASKEKKTKKNK